MRIDLTSGRQTHIVLGKKLEAIPVALLHTEHGKLGQVMGGTQNPGTAMRYTADLLTGGFFRKADLAERFHAQVFQQRHPGAALDQCRQYNGTAGIVVEYSAGLVRRGNVKESFEQVRMGDDLGSGPGMDGSHTQ